MAKQIGEKAESADKQNENKKAKDLYMSALDQINCAIMHCIYYSEPEKGVREQLSKTRDAYRKRIRELSK